MTKNGAEGEVPYRRFVSACGVLAAATGLVALIGWAEGVPVLASLGSGKIPMAPSTAVLLVLYGITIVLRARSASSRAAVWFGVAVHCAGTLVAALLLACSHAQVYPGVEHLGFSAVGVVDGVPIGHMSPATALGFILAGLSFLASLEVASVRSRSRVAVGWYLAWVLFGACYVLLLAYVYGTPLMYGGPFVPPAATTSLAFALLAAALLTLAGPQLWRQSRQGVEAVRAVSVLLLVFAMVAGGISTAGYLYFKAYQAQYRLGVERQLTSVAELKVGELMQYRRERLGDGAMFAANPAFADLVARFLDDPADTGASADLRVWLRRCQAYYQYDRVSFLDARGVERTSFPESTVPVAAVVARRAGEVLGSGEVVLEDFHRNENDQRVYLTVLVPIIGGRDGARALGVLALRIDPETYLYPFISRWPTFSETAETLLVRREGNHAVFLNELRFGKNAPLSLRIPLEREEIAGVAAAAGREGIIEGVDYRGAAVIADMRAIPDSPWFLVARVGLAEAYAPLRERMWMTIVFVAVLLVGAATAVGAVWRHQRAAFYREKYETERDRAWLQDVIARSLNEIYVFDPETLRFSFANAGACRNIGYAADELERLTPLDIKPEFTEEAFRARLQPLRTGAREVLVFDTVHRRKNGSEYPVEVHLQLVHSAGESVFLAIVNDITERRRAELALQRQRDLYDMLAQTNQAIVHCTSRDELFAALCRVAIEHGRFLFAWVGMVDGQQNRVVPVVKYGDDGGYIGKLGIEADPSDAVGRGPTGMAFHTGTHVISNDFANDPSTAPWHELGRRAGVRASAAFPLREQGKVIGTLSLYSSETGLFTEDVLATLDEMASDVAFA
ncbi:MAG: GAF domain-containing protein, partial [Deltaproteobacteria bacterium]|nr:GAF domain-containing protein [Deltaproteobacteria bacterium]